MEFRLILAVVAVISVMSPDIASACSCFPEHPQTSYCRADFVMKAHVKKSKLIYSKEMFERDGKQVVNRYPSQVRYQLHVNKVFKDTEAYRNLSSNFRERTALVYTSVSSAACGVQLKNNTKYLISGFVAGSRAYINLCNMIQEWNSVHIRQRKGLQHLYEKSCKCEIKVCFGSVCLPASSTSCALKLREPGSQCYNSQNACRLNNNGRCKWGSSRSFQHCVKKARDDALREP